MTKNVIVLDAEGNQIGLTYPKRANGLVKSGRAERIGIAAIRLCAPPSVQYERTEAKMINSDIMAKYDEIIKKVEALTNGADFTAALSTLEKADSPAKINAVSKMTEAHEETAKQAIMLYQQLLSAFEPTSSEPISSEPISSEPTSSEPTASEDEEEDKEKSEESPSLLKKLSKKISEE